MNLELSSDENCRSQNLNCGRSKLITLYLQAWNHEFFWESMKPGGGGKPSGELLAQIEKDFGSFETFTSEFKTAAATQFGSGWAWLVCESIFQSFWS